jgi:cyclic-di-GMP-binding protein
MSSATSIIDNGRAASAAPAFSSPAACGAWLDALVRNHPKNRLVELEHQLALLNGHHVAASERFAILELLRAPIHSALTDNRREFADRPLPLKPIEQAALDASLATWCGLADGYLRCVDACRERESGTAGQLAVAVQRALTALAELQLDCYRSGRDVTAGHWRKVHRAYAAAESAGLTQAPVPDALRRGRSPATPFGAWSEALLLQLASLQEAPGRQLGWVAHWVRRWSGKLELCSDPPPASRSAPLFVDIDSDRPAGYRADSSGTQRILDTSQLKRSLKKRILALEDGQAPAELGLGEDCVQPHARELLVQMYFRWCKGGATRRHERRGAAGTCVVIGGLEAAHFHISGGMALARPDRTLSDEEIRRQREEMAVFGRILATPGAPGSHQPLQGANKHQETMEFWRLVDQSPDGLRLVRRADQPGQRFVGKQLVAVRAPDMKVLHLGTVRRATIDTDNALHAGVRILAGEPIAIMVRGTGLNEIRSKAVPAFFLPAMPSLAEPSTIVLPSGWFKRDRVVEVLPSQDWKVRLTGLVERGSDHERATYETVSAKGSGI